MFSQELQLLLNANTPKTPRYAVGPREEVCRIATPQQVTNPNFASPSAATIPGSLPNLVPEIDSDAEVPGVDIPSPGVSMKGADIPSEEVSGEITPTELETSPTTAPPSVSKGAGAEALQAANLGDGNGQGGKRPQAAVTNVDGSVALQPQTRPRDELDGLDEMDAFDGDDDDIPDLSDALAPKPVLGQHTLSPEAVRSRCRRIFQKRSDGSKKVSDEIWNDWHSRGAKKQVLENIFAQCGYDVVPCC